MEQTNDLIQMDGDIQTDNVETIMRFWFEKEKPQLHTTHSALQGILVCLFHFSVLSAVRKTIMGLSLETTRNWTDDE